MGAAYSSLVFRPPEPTYEVDDDGRMMYVRRAGGGRLVPATEPVLWLRTARGSVIPAVYLAVEGASQVLLMAHTNAEVSAGGEVSRRGRGEEGGCAGGWGGEGGGGGGGGGGDGKSGKGVWGGYPRGGGAGGD